MKEITRDDIVFSWINNHIYFHTLEANNYFRLFSSNFCHRCDSSSLIEAEEIPRKNKGDHKRWHFSWINNHTYFRTLEANNLFGDFSSNFCRRSKGFRFHSDVRECFTVPQERLGRGTDTNGIHGIPGPLMRPMINRWQYFKRWLPRPRSCSYFCQQHRAVSQEDVPFPSPLPAYHVSSPPVSSSRARLRRRQRTSSLLFDLSLSQSLVKRSFDFRSTRATLFQRTGKGSLSSCVNHADNQSGYHQHASVSVSKSLRSSNSLSMNLPFMRSNRTRDTRNNKTRARRNVHFSRMHPRNWTHSREERGYRFYLKRRRARSLRSQTLSLSLSLVYWITATRLNCC